MNLNTISLPWKARPTKHPTKGERWNKERENPSPSQKSKTQSGSLWGIQTNHIPKGTCDIVPTPCDIVPLLCPSGEEPTTFLPFQVDGDSPRFSFPLGEGVMVLEFFNVDVPNVFTSCPACVPNVFLEMFPMASHFYLIPFAQSWIFMCYLSMKECSLFVLFCTYEIHRRGMLQIMFLVSLESSCGGGGVHQLGFMAFEYWMISSLKT
jgi:hypothetical protein